MTGRGRIVTYDREREDIVTYDREREDIQQLIVEYTPTYERER